MIPDVDIDFKDRTQLLELIKHIPASRKENGELVRHNTGIYMQLVPYDPEKNCCLIPYDQCKNEYFKIDLCNFSLYDGINSEDDLLKYMNQEPLWELLEQKEFVDLLYHINGHSMVLREMRPKNIEQLAAILAIIRPAKRYLIGKTWEEVLDQVWIKPVNNEYYFKKSHAIAYAVAIVVQMNLICDTISYSYN